MDDDDENLDVTLTFLLQLNSEYIDKFNPVSFDFQLEGLLSHCKKNTIITWGIDHMGRTISFYRKKVTTCIPHPAAHNNEAGRMPEMVGDRNHREEGAGMRSAGP
ncbi:hypothetical protein TNIN_395891 [Trichonephila inaurata madagascariensis]|uniref:Uncharacterized protein n=1 Tax=Trichonephila inaurata madagascariensis TaxID=2747483 RepID=A0A8X6XC52_9ARAC|nr:hypothetical protein TNIN_395891 [Trichonephila inaurata madagascariensis]